MLEVLPVRTVGSQTDVDISSVMVSNTLCKIHDKVLYQGRIKKRGHATACEQKTKGGGGKVL